MTSAPKIFLTGAAGMIGSSIARKLVETGHDVVGIDNLWRGRLSNIKEISNADNFIFRHADIISDGDWFRDMDHDSVVIHTADIVAGIGYVFSNEWQVFQKNLLINTQIARVIHDRAPARLIYLGTACSYPQGLQRSVESSVLREALKFPADPESGYGWSKLMGEVEFSLAAKDKPTKFLTLDLHNVYGWPCVYGDPTSQVIPSLIHRALTSADGRLTVWGDGRQGRAFLHVDDVVSGVVAALAYEGDVSNFMLGPARCTSIREVAESIQRHPEVKIDEIVYDASKPTGDIGRFADASLARQHLGWELRVSFEDGLHDLIDHVIADMRTKDGANA